MPVPVQRSTKPVAHPVIKHNQSGHPDHLNPSVFQHLKHSLPVPSTRPPPSFGTREEWINSLPSWRRTKPRKIWDDGRIAEESHSDLSQKQVTAVVNASVIEGNRERVRLSSDLTSFVKKTVPPSNPPTTAISSPVAHPEINGDADHEMAPLWSTQARVLLDSSNRWTVASPASDLGSPDMDQRSQTNSPACNHAATDHVMYERGAFTPVFEEHSPGDLISSPVGPVTPFGEFVDRVVATAAQADAAPEWYSHADNMCLDDNCDIVHHDSPKQRQFDLPKEPAPLESVVTPSATAAYKKFSEPLSDWVANYVWKVCTTGMSLPSTYFPSTACGDSYPSQPPSHLAASIHSLLLSTLLQPSAVFLAVWYIVRLPVYFGPVLLEVDQVKEFNFRQELLGDAPDSPDTSSKQTNVPFRLILLGYMLANKWLDDNTFSNKTWHTISSVPIQSLNRLESLALAVFEHNLSVPTRAWSQWLAHLRSYHMSLASPVRPQPISRPSANPHSIVRKAIGELVRSPVACDSCDVEACTITVFEPVFLGLEERRKEKMERDHAGQVDIHEIDLDEDGPLREEYLPRRRINADRSRSTDSRDSSNRSLCSGQRSDSDTCAPGFLPANRALPPPAKWSPAADEPILRDRNRGCGQYVAVQPSVSVALTLPPPMYPSFPNGHFDGWPLVGGFHVLKPLGPVNGYDSAVPRALAQPHHGYASSTVPLLSQPRTQPYGRENMRPTMHPRPYNQSCFEYMCSDMHMVGDDFRIDECSDRPWFEQYGYQPHYMQPFGMHPGVSYPLAWLRT